MAVSTITPTELADLMKQGRHIDLIDVRTPAEYREVHAEPARNVPLESLDPVAVQQHRGKDMPGTSLRDLPLREPREDRVRKTGCRRLRERDQRRGRHNGLGAGGAGGRSRPENHFAGTPGADRGGITGSASARCWPFLSIPGFSHFPHSSAPG